MNTESMVNSVAEIQGTIVNVSFPRSGHRFLRGILSDYFEDRFILYESYEKRVVDKFRNTNNLKDVNFVKTHDFQLIGHKVLYFEFPTNRRYLVQIRHPLETIASYYEFAQNHGKIQNDNKKTWKVFLHEKLAYWKQFCELWLTKKPKDSLLITYEDLCADTYQSSAKAIRFLSDKPSVNHRHLTKVIEDQEFLQYVGDSQSKKQHTRRLESFKYFDSTEFEKMESALLEHYFKPHGIKPLLHR